MDHRVASVPTRASNIRQVLAWNDCTWGCGLGFSGGVRVLSNYVKSWIPAVMMWLMDLLQGNSRWDPQGLGFGNLGLWGSEPPNLNPGLKP